jgi:hypothetical protein
MNRIPITFRIEAREPAGRANFGPNREWFVP